MGDSIMSSIIRATTTSGLQIAPDNSGSLQLQTNGTTAAVTIDTSQNVGIGTASPSSKFNVLNTSSSNNYLSVDIQNTAATSTTVFNNRLLRVASNASGADATIQLTDFTAYNAYIGLNGGNLLFGTNGPTERMRIDSSGNLRIGTATNMGGVLGVYNTAVSTGMNVECINASFDTQVIQAIASRAGSTSYTLFRGVANAAVTFNVFGNGNVTNTNGSYGTISDVKLKENIVDATPKLQKVNELKVRNFNIIGNDLKQIGFVAQEIEQVFPSMVEEIADKDKEGNDLGTTTKTVKTTVLIPILVKAIQEQQTIINDLKARVEALEAK
jgi:hypothetical protein